MSPTQPLEDYLQRLIVQLQPAQRRALLRKIVIHLRKKNRQRIAAQTNPDGSAWQPRANSNNNQPMFRRLRQNKYFGIRASHRHAKAFFKGNSGRIAKTHHYGLRDKVSRRSALQIKYPERRLVGITEQDMQEILDIVLDHLSSPLQLQP